MQHIRAHVLICGGTGCKSAGSKEVQLAFSRAIEAKGLSDEVMVVETGCHGFCEHGPLVIVYPEGTFYCQVKAEDVEEIVESHLFKGRIVERLLYHEPQTNAPAPSLICSLKLNPEPKIFSPNNPIASACSIAMRRRLMASGYSART
jgi:(2Fe-2S) ferredoxin